VRPRAANGAGAAFTEKCHATRRRPFHGSVFLDSSHVFSGPGAHGDLLSLHESLRKNLNREDNNMLIYLTALVAVFLVVYLITAMVRPEWF
jgi:hypothetical protein